MDTQELKPTLATVWLGGCSGCHMSFLDMDERLLELAQRVQVRASPLTDVKGFPPVDITLVEGAVALEEHVEHLRLVRSRSKIVVAFGDCAVTGNVTAMRNHFGVDEVLQRSYRDAAAVVKGIPDGSDPVLPRLTERVYPLQEIVDVDHFLQGCPPSADQIYELLTALLDGRAPKLQRRFG
jgi:NAD-reducing hydrogenase small subunit